MDISFLKFPLHPIPIRNSRRPPTTLLSFLPGRLDRPSRTNEIFLRDAILDTLENLLDGGDVVCIQLIIPETVEPPPPLFILCAFHYGIIQWLVEVFHVLPFRRGDV